MICRIIAGIMIVLLSKQKTVNSSSSCDGFLVLVLSEAVLVIVISSTVYDYEYEEGVWLRPMAALWH